MTVDHPFREWGWRVGHRLTFVFRPVCDCVLPMCTHWFVSERTSFQKWMQGLRAWNRVLTAGLDMIPQRGVHRVRETRGRGTCRGCEVTAPTPTADRTEEARAPAASVSKRPAGHCLTGATRSLARASSPDSEEDLVPGNAVIKSQSGDTGERNSRPVESREN